MNSGVYQILNTETLDRYIGSTKDFKKREASHFSLLKNNRHYNVILQNAFNKYGESSFSFGILGRVPLEDLIEVEQLCIDEAEPKYNVRKIVDRQSGIVRRIESNKKQSESMKARYASGKMIAWNRGLTGTVPADQKKKMVAALRAKGAWNKGLKTGKLSDESIKKRQLTRLDRGLISTSKYLENGR